MASARVEYNKSSPLGQPLDRVLRSLVDGRKNLEEFRRIVEKYVDDNQAIADDLGMSVNDVALFRNRLNMAEGLLSQVAVTAVGIGEVSPVRDLIDAMA